MPAETTRGMTVLEVAKYLRIGPDKIRNLIKTGRLGAVNTSTCRSGKPRCVVLPHHLEEYERSNAAVPPPQPVKRRKQMNIIDYFPD